MGRSLGSRKIARSHVWLHPRGVAGRMYLKRRAGFLGLRRIRRPTARTRVGHTPQDEESQLPNILGEGARVAPLVWRNFSRRCRSCPLACRKRRLQHLCAALANPRARETAQAKDLAANPGAAREMVDRADRRWRDCRHCVDRCERRLDARATVGAAAHHPTGRARPDDWATPLCRCQRAGDCPLHSLAFGSDGFIGRCCTSFRSGKDFH